MFTSISLARPIIPTLCKNMDNEEIIQKLLILFTPKANKNAKAYLKF